MNGVASHPVAVPWRSRTVQVALVCATLTLPGVLLFDPTSGGFGAPTTIGIVLAEAIALYLGYGTVTRVAGPPVRELLASD